MIINVLPLSIFAEKLNTPDTLNNPNTSKDTNIFKDVKKGDWFYDSVINAVERNIFSGTSKDTFSPKDPMTRGMYVTMLGRIAKVENDKLIKENPFSDVKSDAYYTPYVIWAAEKGITKGIGESKFGPDILITREQMATFTVRFFDAYSIEYPRTIAKAAPIDFEKINDYAKSAVLKLWNAGLLAGDQNGYFNPKKNATRAEGATFAVGIDKAILGWKEKTQTDIEKPSSNDIDLTKDTKPEIKIPQSNDNNDDNDIGILKYFNIKFNSNGGSEIGTQRVLKGSSLKNLPTPYKENEIFSGWYYDSKLENLVSSKDVVNNDITLYAKYSSVAPLVEAETPSFASALDQGKDFSIQVASLKIMTNEEVKAAIDCINLSSKDKSNLIQVVGDGRIFKVSGHGGFEEGATYKLTLEDENLYFQGLDNSVRKYNFTIAKEEVLNLSLNQDMIYIPFDQISNITQDGKDVENISSTLAKISSDSNSTLSDFTKGTFEYGNPLNIGDTITIYKGIRPDERILNDTREGSDGEIAYLEITAISGNTYSYKNAEIEDVLFRPDVLPISNLSDTDGDPLNNSITVDKAVVQFSDDIYIPMQLDSQTTVDIGDYLAIYEGEFGVNTNVIEYGCITSIKSENETMIISYTVATMDEIISAMDMYATDSVNGDTLLENQDVKALEKNIEEQARASGFADEAAIYLSDLALKTDSFTKLSDDFKMTDFQLLSEDGNPINPEEIRLMASDSKVEVELSTLKATISTKLKHFDTTGVRVTLDIGVEITITVNEDVAIVINVIGSFEEEVHVSINVDGGAKWKWWGPFPYIAEYEATANIDLYNFTGVGINATIVTKEKKDNEWTENKELQNISDELKKLLDAKDKYIGDGEGTVADGLNEKYKAMLENESDWVKLFEKEIFSTDIKIPPALGILVIEISGNFIISANMNISIGCDFYYENAKRYIYTVQVFAKNVTSDVIDIREEHYEFTFYVMGTMGLRAGIKVEIAIGIISTKLGSVGFSAEFGVYARVWGYFYYQLEYTASKGKSSSYSGALLFELGIYLEILFMAQAFAETFSYDVELYAEEWPLWSAGMRENVQDFGYEETDEFTLKKYIRQLAIPDDVFNMTYMDLKTGDVDEKSFDDAKYFTIQITNDAFSYDPEANKLSVNPDEGDFIEEGEMIITWAGAPLAFTSAPIARKFGLYWDNLNNGYTIVFNTNGGSSVPMILNRYNAPIDKPTQPTKKGYNFDGWYSDVQYTTKYVIPELMPNTDIALYAKWIPRDDTEYKVEHYQQNDKNTLYTIVESDTQILYGTTDSMISPAPKDYEGFITPKSQEIKILSDGSSVLRYYYSRGSYTASFDPGQAGGEPTVYKYKYGKPIVAPQINMTGYTFKSWDKEVPVTMPAEDINFIAQWIEAKDIAYRLEHYIQNTNGKGYALSQIERKSGTTNQEININDFVIAGDGISFEKSTVDGKNTELVKIKSDGTLVVKLYYTRNEYKVSFIVENGNNTEKVYRFGEIVEQPITPVKAGYTFTGWKIDEDLTEEFIFGKTMKSKDLIVYGEFKANESTGYRVDHYKQNVSGVGYTLVDVDNLFGTTDMETMAIAKSYTGFTAKAFNQGSISGDETTVVRIEYDRNIYNVNLDLAGGTIYGENIIKYTYGIDTPLPTNISRVGYRFDGWFEGTSKVVSISETENGDKSYLAKWSPENNTSYKVRHLREDLYGQYTIEEIETRYGTTDTETVASGRDYTGFTVISFIQENISGDGSTIIEIRYNRNSYILSWNIIGGSLSGNYTNGNVKFGETIIQPSMNKEGYTFSGWHSDSNLLNKYTVPMTMPAQDINIFGTLTPNSGISYKVIHYLQNANDNGYTAYETEKFNGYTDEEVTSNPKAYNYFCFNENAGGTLLSGNIKADGSLILKLYYDREMFTVNYMVDGEAYGMEDRYKYQQTIVYPTSPSKEGYFFDTWQLNGNAFAGTMLGQNIILTAGWSAGEKSYTIRYFIEKLIYTDESNKWELMSGDSTVASGTFDDEIIVEPGKNYIGFMTPEEQNVILNSNLSTVDFYYTRNIFMLNWILGGGIPNNNYTQSGEVKFETPIIAPTLTMIGHSYTWDKEIEETMADRELEYTANWIANSYVVIFNEEKLESIQVTYGETYGQLPTPSKIGYTFDGWYTNLSGGEKIIEDTLVRITTDQILYAHWTAEVYTLAWDLDGGTASNEYTNGNVAYGTNIIHPIPNKTGYTFTGWDAEIKITMPAENLTYKATWTPKTYNITLNSNGGIISGAVIDYIYGVGVDLPTDVTREGYTFKGWYDGETKVDRVLETATGDKVYTAKWLANSYSITYFNIEGAENHENNVSSYTFGTGLFLGEPTKIGHEFKGWYKDAALNNQVTSISTSDMENIDLYAKWTVKSYQVTLNTDGGTVAAENNITSYTYGEVMMLPISDKIMRNGYTFNGWSDGAKIVTEIPLGSTGPKSYIATWSIVSYDISYELNGGTNSSDNPDSYNVSLGDINLADPSKVGHIFGGWFTDSTFVTPATSPAIVGGKTGNITFYAKWTPFSYSVVFNPNEGTGTMSYQTFNVGESKKLSLNNFSREGYNFVGWSKSPIGAKHYDNESIVSDLSIVNSSVVNLYALWTPINYTITYNLNGGTNAANPGTYNIETQGIILKDPTRDGGYVFNGWYNNPAFTGEKVTLVVAGSLGNLNLYAQWKHYGLFNISGVNNIFTITRTGGTDGTQTVYYRTQNGSAIGGTHFTHKEDSVTFLQGETSKVVTIAENSVTSQYSGYVATSYSNVDRVYYLDIYKVDGGGKLGTNIRGTRTMTKDASFIINSIDLNNAKSIASVSSKNQQIWEDSVGGWDATASIGLSSPVLNNSQYSANLQNYIKNTASGMKITLSDFYGKDDGWRMYRFVLFNDHVGNQKLGANKGNTVPDLLSNTKSALVYGIGTDTNNTDNYSVNLPANIGNVSAMGTSHTVKVFDIKWTNGQDKGNYVLYGFDETCGISVGGYNSATANSSWFFNGGKLNAAPKDIKEPTLLNVAPMASTTFNVGEKVIIALIFDEIVQSASNVSITTGFSNTPFTITGGLGTNILYFEGTVSNYGADAPTKNNILINNPENIKDMCN